MGPWQHPGQPGNSLSRGMPSFTSPVQSQKAPCLWPGPAPALRWPGPRHTCLLCLKGVSGGRALSRGPCRFSIRKSPLSAPRPVSRRSPSPQLGSLSSGHAVCLAVQAQLPQGLCTAAQLSGRASLAHVPPSPPSGLCPNGTSLEEPLQPPPPAFSPFLLPAWQASTPESRAVSAGRAPGSGRCSFLILLLAQPKPRQGRVPINRSLAWQREGVGCRCWTRSSCGLSPALQRPPHERPEGPSSVLPGPRPERLTGSCEGWAGPQGSSELRAPGLYTGWRGGQPWEAWKPLWRNRESQLGMK